MANGKVVVSAVSIILVVGVVIGTVAVVSNNNSSHDQLKSHNKAVEKLCQNADDKKLCYDVIGNVNTTDPKDYVSEVVKRTLDTVIKAFNMTDSLSVEHGESNPGMKMALDDCKDLLQSATHELEASINLITDNNFANVYQSSAELKNWLGAVIAYQQSCMDGFDTDGEKKVKTELQADSLDSVGQLTALALDVVSGLSHFLNGLGLNLNLKPASRKLLEVDHEGYPTWLSAADRKLLQDVNNVRPNVVVAKDGSGQFKTVLEAINSYPKNYTGRYIIYVKAGVYDEYITVDKKFKNLFIYGDGNTKTIITGRKNFHEGTKTMRTSTFSTNADDFIAKSIAFENTAGAEGHQAVALRVQGDRSAFFDCAMRGYQDTLYAHAHRQFYRNCEISGTIDFIFGYGTTLIQNSRIIVRKPMSNQQNIVVADGTDQKNMPTGIVLQNCEIMADSTLYPDRLTVRTFLARPWKAFSRAVFIENTIGDLIQPQGYIPWNPPTEANTDNCYFVEYGNTGAGANAGARAPFAKGIISKDEASQFLAERWIQASTWVPATGITYDAGFTKA
ncbi:pectinesterase [Arachis duranensis]|uniref:Pectinesterase n=1 Tax=Arachis duranensis TaxID=130453 RepID=A0A6P4BKY9_ARADU|nr:pectinesterase [Arachis duranensis]XP_057734024.1 pectinesterase-like [Arachis stenosperma]